MSQHPPSKKRMSLMAFGPTNTGLRSSILMTMRCHVLMKIKQNKTTTKKQNYTTLP